MRIPQHVAIILDGNGRWAKSKGMPRNYGHTMGAKNVEVICEDAYHMGIQYLTLYAFSTENWNRPDTEVEALMKLLATYLKNCIKRADKNNMRIRVIGDISRLDAKFRNTIRELEEATKKNTGLNLQIALNYGSRDEMIRAIKKMVKDHDAGKLATEDITEECFSSYLDTKEILLGVIPIVNVISGFTYFAFLSGHGSADPYQWRAASVELSALAACIQ